ncbi:hypothetical protein [Amycolatopsis sp. CA-126428]|uniref:hypothetical protein n=1 Tax=Amycolatopsis sp. CA-126428 TaxID=2073158 RepID=UPI0011B0EAF2|nr:hypothetical protein [Amycolatopsis sp. CA-126428]
MRDIVAVIVAADSPAGQAAEAINDLSAHLPEAGQPRVCPMCSAEPWPCGGFHNAAQQVMTAGLRLAELVPADLHPILWPPKPPPSPTPRPAERGAGGQAWFDGQEPSRG